MEKIVHKKIVLIIVIITDIVIMGSVIVMKVIPEKFANIVKINKKNIINKC
jgi:hypothetical protein